MEKEIKLRDLDYPECLDEIIKHMDWFEGTDEEKKAYIEVFVAKVTKA